MKTIELSISDKNKSLLTHLQEKGEFLPAYCAGRGTCGKCKVQFLNNIPAPTTYDSTFFSEKELSEGWRLACQAYVEGQFTIQIEDYEEDQIQAASAFNLPDKLVSNKITTANTASDASSKTTSVQQISVQHTLTQLSPEKSDSKIADTQLSSAHNEISSSEALALAIDIGTTTIAANLIDTNQKKVLQTITSINHQRIFGTDVLSRIDAANQGRIWELQRTILNDLDSICEQFQLGKDITKLSIPVIISGNSTMQHLLQRLSCESLGSFPFTPVDISMHSYKDMTILPGISTYVGADIVSGIVACGIDQKEEISLLVDLGTNGEMVIGNKNRLLVTSTAAGPAFEGGNIRHGIAGVPGAIDTVTISNNHPVISTISNKKPIGICGTGVIETVYELVKEKIVDNTGLIADKYFDTGYPLTENISFTNKDIREVQLAKSAIRAGIEILVTSYGIDYSQIAHLYLAGGFGQKINYTKAVGIGMLPKELNDRIISVGNSSLAGAGMLAMNPELSHRFTHIPEISEEINLANHKAFNDLYLEYMSF